MWPHEHRTREAVIGEPARKAHLHVVDTRTGELVDAESACVECLRLRDQLKGAESDIRKWRAKHADLKRDKDAEARDSDLWPAAVWLFQQWQVRCNHPNAAFTPDRFWCIHPFLSNPKYGETLRDRVRVCLRAIKGAAYDPYTKKRKNGTVQRFDGFELVFRDAAHLEEFANKAPRHL